jgi:hypothetical protein
MALMVGAISPKIRLLTGSAAIKLVVSTAASTVTDVTFFGTKQAKPKPLLKHKKAGRSPPIHTLILIGIPWLYRFGKKFQDYSALPPPPYPGCFTKRKKLGVSPIAMAFFS